MSNEYGILKEVASYYARKIKQHGSVPAGVDWNGEGGQRLRFQQLLKIVDSDSHFSVNDLGCGYGALLQYLMDVRYNFNYTGVDVSKEMVAVAKAKYHEVGDADFFTAIKPTSVADYSVASGIFNVKLEVDHSGWEQHVCSTLSVLAEHSKLGFSFNCLTSYSDEEKKKKYLHYADPCKLFDYCKRHFSRNVALVHDYGLYEFTMLVKL